MEGAENDPACLGLIHPRTTREYSEGPFNLDRLYLSNIGFWFAFGG